VRAVLGSDSYADVFVESGRMRRNNVTAVETYELMRRGVNGNDELDFMHLGEKYPELRVEFPVELPRQFDRG